MQTHKNYYIIKCLSVCIICLKLLNYEAHWIGLNRWNYSTTAIYCCACLTLDYYYYYFHIIISCLILCHLVLTSYHIKSHMLRPFYQFRNSIYSKMTLLAAIWFVLFEVLCFQTYAQFNSIQSSVNGTKISPSTGNITKKSQQDEVDILPPHYYRDVAPMINGRPVKVTVSVVILNIKLSSGSSQVKKHNNDYYINNN